MAANLNGLSTINTEAYFHPMSSPVVLNTAIVIKSRHRDIPGKPIDAPPFPANVMCRYRWFQIHVGRRLKRPL